MKNSIRKLIGIVILGVIGVGVIGVMVNVKNREEHLYVDIKYQDVEKMVEREEECYVLVYSTICATCNKLKDDLLSLKDESVSFVDKKIFGINIDEMDSSVDDFFEKYKVEGVPFVVCYKNGIQQKILYEDITREETEEFFD